MLPPDLRDLESQLDAVERDARALVEGLDEERGGWRAADSAWSIAECLDHLATADRVYLRAMEEAAQRARRQGRFRRGPAAPGTIGRWFVGFLEPPATIRTKAPRTIRPRAAPALADAVADFLASHAAVRGFLHAFADLDLAGRRFVNPFIPGVRFSLATGLHVIAAHERRHLWQAWRVRRQAEVEASD